MMAVRSLLIRLPEASARSSMMMGQGFMVVVMYRIKMSMPNMVQIMVPVINRGVVVNI